MSKILLQFVESPLFEVFSVWLVCSLITIAFRPGSELEAWTKQKGPRYFAALQMLRRAATDLPELADWVATFLWKRSPEQAQNQLTTVRILSVSPPPGLVAARVDMTPVQTADASRPLPHAPPLPRTDP